VPFVTLVPPAGVAAALAIGLALGLLGGGGSILTVPALVYLVDLEAKVAIATSLVVVGMASVVGAAAHARAGNVDRAVTLRFAPVAMAGAFVGARLAARVPGAVQLSLLAITMIVTAGAMLRPRPPGHEVRAPKSPTVLSLVGLGVGVLTGVVGVGGGFLMLPALTELGGVPMRRAVGTSLVVILLNAVAASLGYAGQVAVAWGPALIFGGAAALGTIAGTQLAGRFSDQLLRRAFAGMLIGLGLFMLLRPSS
jgi:uncharacterized membrane protein YfcA